MDIKHKAFSIAVALLVAVIFGVGAWRTVATIGDPFVFLAIFAAGVLAVIFAVLTMPAKKDA